ARLDRGDGARVRGGGDRLDTGPGGRGHVDVASGRRRADRLRRAPGRLAEPGDARPGHAGVTARADLLARLSPRRVALLARPVLHLSVALRLLHARPRAGPRLPPDVHV